MNKFLCLIPARGNSKRIKNKNIKNLKGHPLIAYTIDVALESKLFHEIVCVTDKSEYKQIAEYYGAKVPRLRPKHTATSKSPDIEWVKWILEILDDKFDAFCILRPTSPLRKKRMFIDALKIFQSNKKIDSVRAVNLCSEHPGKMWKIKNRFKMEPLLEKNLNGTPWHSHQYANLPEIYVQNASFELSRIANIKKYGTISGNNVAPLITQENDGFDINTDQDWNLLEQIIKKNPHALKKISKKSYFQKKQLK